MSSKIGVYWSALPAIALATAFFVSTSDKSYGAEAVDQTVVAAQPVTLPPAVPLAVAAAAVADEAPVVPGGVVFEETPAESADDSDGTAMTLADSELECLAKIVHHESANQPEAGQFAVAHVVLNRLASPRFPKSVCAIALQPGQFFNVHAYNPTRDHRWPNSLRIAREALSGEGADAAPGALFFHTAGYSSSFFRSRPRVTQIAGHVFYR